MQINNKILIIGPAWIGDMVMAQVLFKLLKEQTPNVELHVLAPSWVSPLLERMPEVDHILISPFRHGKLDLIKRYKLGKALRQEHYSQAIILPNSFKSALVPYFAHISKRTGWRGEMRYGLLNDVRVLDKRIWPLMIQRFAVLGIDAKESLPEKLSWPSLRVDTDNVELLRRKFNLDANQRLLAICPGAEYGQAKRWPAKYFAKVAKIKLQEGWQVLVFGGKNDQDVASEIQKITNNGCLDLTGKTTLLDAIDLLSVVKVVVTNDTGLMHIAAALQKPLVVIYGSSSPQFTPPLYGKVKILTLNLSCSPCFKRQCPPGHLNCLQNLFPEMVIKAIEEVIISC